jgi:two-component system capsular synthesis sensor histidine kinase RcsC
VIEVRDQGIGVPDTFDVFSAFRQADKAVAAGHGGVGLGLHIVRKLVLALGGDVTVAHNTGAGSTFTVRLPLPA